MMWKSWIFTIPILKDVGVMLPLFLFFKTPDAQSLAPSRADLQAGLIENEQKTHRSKGVTSWLATGLKIEEAQ